MSYAPSPQTLFPCPVCSARAARESFPTHNGGAVPYGLFWEAQMGKKLYVGNLPYGVNDADLQQMFGQFGTVQSAQVIMDRDTGRSKGFGFVEMGSDQEAQAAITGMNGKDLDG